MAFKFVVFFAVVAYVNAGYLGAPAAVTYSAAPAVSHVSYSSPLVSYGSPHLSYATPAITTQQQNILRSPGNLAQISTYSKTIDTPYSSVSKSDFRVSNPGLAVAAAPALAYHAAPAVSYAAAAPLVAKTYAAPALAAPLLAKSYAAPAVTYTSGAPLLAKSYAAPAVSYAAAAPLVAKTYAAPALAAQTYAAPSVAAHGLLGVAYSAAPAVSHMTYSNGLGLSYGW